MGRKVGTHSVIGVNSCEVLYLRVNHCNVSIKLKLNDKSLHTKTSLNMYVSIHHILISIQLYILWYVYIAIVVIYFIISM